MYGPPPAILQASLCAEFAQQMLVAVLIFAPFTYIFLKEWLRNFVYSTPFSWMDPLIPDGILRHDYYTSLRISALSLVALI